VIYGSGLRIPQQQTKRKIFISYHHGGDQAYYDAFSRVFGGIYDVIYDNSLERKVDSEDTTYVMRRIREHYVTGSSCTVVLVGRDTWGRKYVDWEILRDLAASGCSRANHRRFRRGRDLCRGFPRRRVPGRGRCLEGVRPRPHRAG